MMQFILQTKCLQNQNREKKITVIAVTFSNATHVQTEHTTCQKLLKNLKTFHLDL